MGRLQTVIVGTKSRLILASGSPRRKELLAELGVPFDVVVSDVNEDIRENDPKKLVMTLAERKARAVAKKHPGAVVIGADTTVACKGEILNKPNDAADGLRMLKLLNGSWQQVYTGVAVAAGDRVLVGAAKTSVKSKRLSDEDLKRLAGKHLDKAGGYAVQDTDDPFIERISGDYDNVVGLPMKLVRRLLKRAGFQPK